MSFESFYGGRQGASFIIVKRFDGIDIPEKTESKIVYYAINNNKVRYYPFIIRTDQNYNDYDWLLTKLDGSTVNVELSDGTISTEVLDILYQEGMRQCFEKGGDSTDVVNYGEYVIIDTLSKDNPENGKVFRRGMNFDYDPINNPLAGAEYIGQIIGPKGSTAEIDITTYKEVTDKDPHQIRSYTVVADNQGLIPGTDINRTTFNDTIDYAWATLRDEAGNVDYYQVGFKFPYLIPEFTGRIRSPYYTQEDYDLGRISNINLIGTPINFIDDFNLFIDNGFNTADRVPDHGDTGHPFYRKWKITIPKGIKGDTATEIKIFPTIVPRGMTVYSEAAVDGTLSGTEIELDVDATIIPDSYWDTFEKGYVTIEIDNTPYYCYLTDTAELHYGYLWTWYDEHEDGQDHKWIDVGPYRTIDYIHLDEHGWVTVYYKAGNPDTLEEALRWVWLNSDPDNTKGVQIEADGSIIIWYNTLDEHGDHEFQKYENILTWLNEITLNRNGHLKINYNNESLYDANNPYSFGTPGWTKNNGKAAWETDLTWPAQVSLTESGVLKFLYNNNLLNDIYPDPWAGDGTIDRNEGSYNFIMPWLTKVKLFNDGYFNFVFNNNRLYDNTDTDWKSDQITYAPQITWVTEAKLEDNGTFTLSYNNDINKNATIADGGTWIDATHSYVSNIIWVKDVEIANDGTITFIYCDDTVAIPHKYVSPYKLKYLTDISINVGNIEGTGNQKVHLIWNTINSITGNSEEEDIGNPLNYIIESTISIPSTSYPNVPYWHLLVYYSDPALRDSLRNKWITYPSTKYAGTIWDEWVDLGPVKGENTGIHVLKNVTSMDDLKDGSGNWIPPERLPDSDGTTILNPDGAGWSCTLQEPGDNITYYLFYDYDSQRWYKGTAVDPSAVEPQYVITKSAPNANSEPFPGDADDLKSKGFWFAVQEGIAIK